MSEANEQRGAAESTYPQAGSVPSTTSTQLTSSEHQPERGISAMARAKFEAEEFVDMVHQLDASTTTLIPEGVVFRGSIDTQGRAAVIVKGTHEGTINAGDMPVYVAPGAKVCGQIQSLNDVYVAGHVASAPNSDDQVCIKTEKRFLLAGTGVVEGDVEYGAVRIYDGVISGRLLPAVSRTFGN